MKQLFKTRYRIVRDSYAGFEVQFKYWWMPFFFQYRTNTFASIDRAKDYLEMIKQPVVYEE